MLEKYDLAIADLQEALNLGLESAATYSTLGTAHLELKKFDVAMKYLSMAIELDAAFPFSYYSRAAVYAEMGNRSAAIEDLNKCLSLGPDPNMKAKILQRLQDLT